MKLPRGIDMVLFAVIGNPGEGKTLTMTYLLFKKWLVEGKKIYANYHLYKFPYMFVGSVSTFDKIEDGCFGGDELWLNVDARDRKSAKTIITNILAKSRKKNLIIYYTTQLLDSIDKRVKKITDFVASPILNADESICKVIIYRCIGGKFNLNTYMKTIYYNADVVKMLYNTYEVVKPWPDEENKSNDELDGKIIFQEDEKTEPIIFNNWDEAYDYAGRYWIKNKQLLVGLV